MGIWGGRGSSSGNTITVNGLKFRKRKFDEYKRTPEGFKAVPQSGYTVKVDQWWSFGISHEGKEIVITELSTGASIGRFAENSSNDIQGTKEYILYCTRAAAGKVRTPSYFTVSPAKLNGEIQSVLQDKTAKYRINGDGTMRINVRTSGIVGKTFDQSKDAMVDTHSVMISAKQDAAGWHYHMFPSRDESRTEEHE